MVSGDLTERNLPEEFEAAGEFLLRTSSWLAVPPANFVVVPGNHDSHLEEEITPSLLAFNAWVYAGDMSD